MAVESSSPEIPREHERRRHPRRLLPRLILSIEDHTYRTRDWSLGGFRISGFHRDVRPGEQFNGSVVTWLGLRRETFDTDVVRLTPEGDVSFRFLTLPRVVLKIFSRL